MTHWYHSIETEPGVITPGEGHLNLAATRTAMAGVDMSGAKVLDIACMDGLMAVLATRRGASRVWAWDREQRVNCDWPGVQHVHGAWNWCLNGLQCFDVTICSGLLYHVFDPLAWLMRARAATRNGGVLVIETAAWRNAGSASLVWNGGRYYVPPQCANYWFPTLGLLAEWLKFARLVPLKVAWFPQTDQLCRIAVCCRALPTVCPTDPWLKYHEQCSPESAAGQTFGEFIEWEHVESTAPDVPVSDGTRCDVRHLPPPIDAETIKRLGVLRLEDLT